MKKTIILVITILISFCSILSVTAENKAESILAEKDIENFIKNFRTLERALDPYDIDIDDPEDIEKDFKYKNYSKDNVISILNKNGIQGKNSIEKLIVIGNAFIEIKYKNHDAKSSASTKSDAKSSATTKSDAKSGASTKSDATSSATKGITPTVVSTSDLELIKKHYQSLARVFD